MPAHGAQEATAWTVGLHSGGDLLRDMWTVASRRYRAFCRGSGWKPLLVK